MIIYKITNKSLNKCVSTIPDECKGVETEIGTVSERKTTPLNNKE